MANSPDKLSPEEQQVVELYVRGRRLQDLVAAEGWDEALRLLEGLVAEAEYHLHNYNGSDASTALALQRRARDYRECRQRFLQAIETAIAAAKEVPSFTRTGLGGLDE